MNCSDAKRMQRGYLDHELSYDEEAALREHLGRCTRCADEFASLEACLALLKDLPETDPGPAFLPAVLEKVSRAESRGWQPESDRIGWTERLRAGLNVLVARPMAVGIGALTVGVFLGGGAVYWMNSGGAGSAFIAQMQPTAPASRMMPAPQPTEIRESPISDLAIDIPRVTDDAAYAESEAEYVLDPYTPDSQLGLVPYGADRLNASGDREQSDVYITF